MDSVMPLNIAISNSRILELTEDKVTFSARGIRPGDPKRQITLKHMEFIRRYLNKDVPPTSLNLYDTKWVKDVRGRDYLIFRSEWCIKWAYEKNEGIELAEFGTAQDDDE